MRLGAALLLLLACGHAAAETDALDCRPTVQVDCTANGTCTEGATLLDEVRFWPERRPVDECRATHCPPLGPSILVCGPLACGRGTVDYAHEPAGDPGVRKGMAYTSPDPPPRLYAATFYVLAFEPASGTLALSRFHPDGLETTWFACSPAEGE